MQIIFLLLALFAIGCVLYGISAGVQIIVRSFSRLTGSNSNSTEQKESVQVQQTPTASKAAADPLPISAQHYISELQILFEIYKNGGLTKDEFEKCKFYVLSTIAHDSLESF